MKIACMFSIGYGVNSNLPSIVLSWLLCFWLHSVMVSRFAPELRINIKRLFFFLIALLGCDPAVQHWELDQSCSQRKRSLPRDKTNKAKNRTTLPGQTENTSRWRISHKGLQTEQHTLRTEQLRVIKCIPEQKKHGRKLSKADGEKRARCLPQSGSIPYLPVSVCALQQWSAFLSTTEPLTLHTDLLTALVTVSDNCCQSCCERTHLDSRVCLCTPQDCHRQQHKQVGGVFFGISQQRKNGLFF